MDDKEKRDSSWNQDYAQEDWYKSNRTPEGSDSYEFGDEMVPGTKKIDSTRSRSNQKLNEERANNNEVNLSKQNLSQEKLNFEFGRDNYFNTNGTVNNHDGGVSMDRSRRNTTADLSSMKEENYGDDVDFEFGSDNFKRSEFNDINKKNNKEI